MKKLMAILMVTAVSTAAVAVFADETPQTNKFPRVHVDPVPTTQAQAKNVSVVTEVTPSVSKPVEIPPAQEIEWTKVPLVVILAAVKANPTLANAPAVVAALAAAITKLDVAAITPEMLVEIVRFEAPEIRAALASLITNAKATDINPALLSELVRINAPEIQVAVAVLFSNIDVGKIPSEVLAQFVKANADTILAVATNTTFRLKAPILVSAIQEKPSAIRTPAVFAALVSSLTEANAGDCFAALLAAYNNVTAQSVNPAKTVSGTFDPKLWYESNYAPGGSRLWAIVQRAKFAAARGEDLTELHKAFLQTLNAWIMEDQ